MIKTASVQTKQKVSARAQLKELEKKAEIFDALVCLIEDRYLGSLMEEVEKEKNITLSRTKKLLC